MREPTKATICGDWHGRATWGREQIIRAGLVGSDALIVVGDFGYWVDSLPTTHFLMTVNEQARESGVDLYFLDGNHEDHSRLVGLVDADEPVPLPHYSNITYLPRGFRWEWWGKTFMSVGGAPSVDKDWRTEGLDWWPAEELTDAQVERCCRAGDVDVVLAHDCPTGVFIPNDIGDGIEFRPSEYWPDEAIHRSNRHRAKMAAIADAVQPSLWINGHYHVPFHGQRGEMNVVILNCDGSNFVEHCFVMERNFAAAWSRLR